MNYTPILYVVIIGDISSLRFKGVITLAEINSLFEFQIESFGDRTIWYFEESGKKKRYSTCSIDEFYKLQIKRQLDIEVLRD